MSVLTYSSKKILYFREGTSPKAIIFIHGDGQNHTSGTELLKAFPHSYSKIAFDRPGHGESQELIHRTLEQEAEIVQEIVKKEQLKEVILAGHSGGAVIAITYALKHPVKSLILLDPFFFNPRKVLWYLPIKLLEKRYLAKITGTQKPYDFSTEKNEKELGLVTATHNSYDTLKRNLDLYEDYDLRKQIDKLPPTLIIASTKGLLALHKHVKVAKSAKIELIESTHNFILFEKRLVDELVKKHLAFLGI